MLPPLVKPNLAGWLAAASIGVLLAANVAHAAGPVTGVIDDVRYEGDQYYVSGWACQEGVRNSIGVHIYAGGASGGKPPGTFVTPGTADLPNEPAVDHECHDADGGKHRFKIALSNQLLRTFQNKKLWAHGIAAVGNVENAAIAGSGRFVLPAPKWPPDPPTPNFLDGPPAAAFDTKRDSCELIDIPDAGARAFRDDKKTIHLIASHYVTRASVGPTLETVKHDCQVVYKSARDGDPADFNDYTWLTQFFSVDGKKIVAFGHMEYHGWEHPGMCAGKSDTPTCWYNVDTFFTSSDGGYHFVSAKPPANYLLSLPAKYEPNKGPEGYSVDLNIVKVGDWYYAAAYSWAWPPGCGQGKGQQACLAPDATCPIRTANILDPTSWRGWDGKDFTVTFADPYKGPVTNPQSHVCAPVSYLDYANAVNYNEAAHLFVATLWNQGSGGFGPQGVYFSTSPDFIHWSKPALALTLDQMLRREPNGNWSYMYFSLIDPNASDASFVTITDHPYLYYVRMDNDHGPYQRVLFRQRVKLDWLLKAAEAQAAAHPAPPQQK
jgi:hypothetical protein